MPSTKRENFMQYYKTLLELQKRIATVNEIHQNCLKSIQPTKEIANRYQNALESLSKIQQSYTEIIEPLNQFSRTYADSLSSLNKTIASVVLAKNTYLEHCDKLNEMFPASFTKPLIDLSDISLRTLNKPYDSSNEILFTDNDVIISDEALANISSAIEIPSNCITQENSKGTCTHIPFKEFFLYILYPLILVIIPMIQSDYLDSRNALESKKQILKIQEYEENLLQIDKEIIKTNEQILNSLNQILDSLNNFPESQQFDYKNEGDSPPHQFDTYTPEEVAGANDDVLHNSNKSDNID